VKLEIDNLLKGGYEMVRFCEICGQEVDIKAKLRVDMPYSFFSDVVKFKCICGNCFFTIEDFKNNERNKYLGCLRMGLGVFVNSKVDR